MGVDGDAHAHRPFEGEAGRDQPVDGRLGGRRKAPLGQRVHRHTTARCLHEREHGLSQPPFGEGDGMDAMGELTELVTDRGDTHLGQCEGLGRGAVRARPCPRQPEAERQQPLLRAVMEVALQPAALGLAGRDEPQAGLA